MTQLRIIQQQFGDEKIICSNLRAIFFKYSLLKSVNNELDNQFI